MDERQFDALARALGDETPRRRLLQAFGLGSLATALLAFGDSTLAGKRQRRRRQQRRRKERRKVQVCHEGTLISVRRKAVESHLQHGDQLGSCDLEQTEQTCENAKLPCNTDPTFCSGEGCMCFVTTTGGSICAQPSIECKAGGTCTVDQDCVDRLGDGYYCVPTWGCDEPGCTQSGNACTQACQPS